MRAADRRSPQQPQPRYAASLGRAVGAAVLAIPVLCWGAPAYADQQTDLCSGAPSGCAISLSNSNSMSTGDSLRVIDSGVRYTIQLQGSPGVSVDVQFYAVEFNSKGEVTALVPSGTAVNMTPGSSKTITPRAVGGGASGWGFVGLADSSSSDLRTRVGSLYEFSGLTLKTLGDGYAQLKPVDTTLEMWTLGNVRGVGYWVEYQDADGLWRSVPGQGYNSPQRITTTPGETSAVTYTVPSFLEAGQAYQFRINSHLNFSGPNALVTRPEYVEWTVVPSGGSNGTQAPRGDQLKPDAAPGVPDPTGDPAPSEPNDSGEVSVAPTPSGPQPGKGGGAGAGGGSGEAPAPSTPSNAGRPQQGTTATAVPQDVAQPAPSATSTITTSPTPTRTPNAGPTPTSSTGGALATPSAAPGPAAAGAAAPVWGQEAFTATSAASRVEGPTSWVVLAVLLGALVAPSAWAARAWIRARREPGEVSA